MKSNQMLRWQGILLGALLVFATSSYAHAKKPCVKLAEQVCMSVGILSFVCRVHQKAAQNPKASQKVCRQSLKKWSVWGTYMKKLEQRVSIIEKQAAGFGIVGERKAKRFKARQSKDIINYLCGVVVKRKSNAEACMKLYIQVCRDIGRRSYYCRFFRNAAQAEGAKASQCATFLTAWPRQKLFYESQEKRMQKMIKASLRNPKLRPDLQRIQQKELLAVLKFLRGVKPKRRR